MKVVPEDESVGAANHARGLQFGGNAPSGISGMQEDKRLPGRRDRLHERPSQPSAASEDSKQNECEEGAHLRDSLDEGWPLVVGRWSLAVGHMGWPVVIA